MKAFVLCDEHGKVIAIGRPEEVEGEPSESEIERLVPQSGQRAYEIDLPAELEKVPLLKLNYQFRVDLKGKSPRFMRVREATEPSKKK